MTYVTEKSDLYHVFDEQLRITNYELRITNYESFEISIYSFLADYY